MRRRILVEIALFALIVVAINYLSARHFWRGDWTRGRSFQLSPKTEQLVRGLTHDVDVIIFMMPSGEYANDLYSDVRELAERTRRLSDKLHVEYIDIDRQAERARVLGKKYSISEDDLRDGVIVVASGEQSKFITRNELADYDWSTQEPGSPPPMKAWKGEQAFASALLAVTEERAPTICFASGHGEPAIDNFEPGEYGDFAEELKRDHQVPRAIVLDQGVPDDCDVTVLAGPTHQLERADVLALERRLERGGRLLVMMGPSFDAKVTHFVDVGVEDLFDRWGASLHNDIVIDEPRLRGSPFAFAISEGYADHPITRHLMHQRTLWSTVREVRATPKPGLDAREIVHSSDAGWGETDLGVFNTGELRFDAKHDVKGPVPVAVAVERTEGTGQGARLVVFGSAELAGNRQALDYNRDLLLSAIAWLEARPEKIAVGPRATEHLRLDLDDRQLSRVFLVCVIALPLLALLVGAGVFWVRRS